MGGRREVRGSTQVAPGEAESQGECVGLCSSASGPARLTTAGEPGASSAHKQACVYFGNGSGRPRWGGRADTLLRRLTPQSINTHSRGVALSHLPKVTREVGPGVTKPSLRGFPPPDAGPGHRAAEWSS